MTQDRPGSHGRRRAPLLIERRNATYQVFDALKNNRRQRAKRGLLFVEGVAAINCLVANGGVIETLIMDASRTPSDWARGLAGQAMEIAKLAGDLMAELSERDATSEVIAIARRPTSSTTALGKSSFALVFDRPTNEGNLGSIIRSADAFDVDAIVTTGHGVDTYDPKTIRASIGTVFNRAITHMEGPELETWITSAKLAAPDLQVVTTSGTSGASLDTYERPSALVLVVGNETHGVSRQLREFADVELTIPMAGYASSLNVSAATAILLYALRRRDAD